MTILWEFCEFAQHVSTVFLPQLELNHVVQEPIAESQTTCKPPQFEEMILNATIQATNGNPWGLKKKYPVLMGFAQDLGRQNQVNYIILSNFSKNL